MKVLFLSKYGRLAASTRYRHEQYLPILRASGIDAVISPLLSDTYLQVKFTTGRTSLRHLLGAFLRRVWVILNAGKYDLLVVHCELFPYLPSLFERYLALRGIPYLYDFDDAIFHQYDLHKHFIVRKLLGRKIAHVIQSAAAVTAGNAYLGKYALRFNPQVHLLPTVVNVSHYDRTAAPLGAAAFTIGWIGSPSTAKYVKERESAFSRFCKKHDARLVLIGSGPMSLNGVPLVVKDWNEAFEVEELRQFDVGIMPLTDDPWAAGKCGFKLIQYMAAKLPVIASPVGVNAELITPSREGLLATTDDEWVHALEVMIANPAERRAMGQRGYEKVRLSYSLEAQGPRFAELILNVGAASSKSKRNAGLVKGMV